MQVELAQLEYIKTRLTGSGVAMSRLGGGIGTRGPGETKLEVDRRRIEHRITVLRRQLKKIEQERAVQRKRRNNVIQLTLAGYTNAGKSTLFNRLTNSQVKVSEQLFATLDASTRMLPWQRGVPVVLTDTVGFIRNLPAQLVASFRSTLAEIKDADLIIHVADASDALVEQRIDIVNDTLRTIDAWGKPTILTFNKIDRLFDDIMLRRLKEHYPDAVFISAVTGAGIDELTKRIATFLDSQLVIRMFTVPKERWDLIARIISSGQIVSDVEVDGKRQFRVKGLPGELARLRKKINTALKLL